MVKYLTKYGLAVISACLLSANAAAVVISNPLGYTTAGLVGTAKSSASNANPETVTQLANQILALGVDTWSSIDDVVYQTHRTDDYSGTLSLDDASRINAGNLTREDDAVLIAEGYDYVVGKYNGKNAGWVLFYLGGEASSIPWFPYDLWTTHTSQWELSNVTLYRTRPTTPVPEPGALTLLGAGLLGLLAVRRKRAA